MKVLVTGGAGFIGTRLVELLHSNGAEVWVFDAKDRVSLGWEHCQKLLTKRRVVRGRVENMPAVQRMFKKANFDLCFHLAAQSHVDMSIADPSATIEVNSIGTYNIAIECSRQNIPLLYCSTDEVYGDTAGRKRASKETDVLNPSSPYSASKAAGELLVRSVSRTFGLTYAITRGTNAFGSNQYPEKLVPIACKKLKNGEKVPLHGDGLQVRQWIHVDEFAEFMSMVGLGLISKDRRSVGQTYNIAGPVKVPVVSLVEKIAEYMGIEPDDAHERVPDRPGGDREYSVDGTKAYRKFGFQAKRRITDPVELEKLVDSYSADADYEVAIYGE